MRHFEVRFLWVQEVVRRGWIRLKKIPGKSNPADALTKFKGAHLEPLINLIKYGKYRLSPEQESLDERRQEKEAKGYNSRRKTGAPTLSARAGAVFPCPQGIFRSGGLEGR